MRVVQWLLVALVIAAQATETSFVTDQLRQRLPQGEYNAELVDMLELSLKGGKIDDVIGMLQKMVETLTGAQNAANMEYSTVLILSKRSAWPNSQTTSSSSRRILRA